MSSQTITTATPIPNQANQLVAGSYVSFPQPTPGFLQFSIVGTWSGVANVYTAADGENLYSVSPTIILGQTGAQAGLTSGSQATYTVGPVVGEVFLIFTALSSGQPTATIGTTVPVPGGSQGQANSFPASAPSLADLGPLYAIARPTSDVFGGLPNGWGPNLASVLPQAPPVQNPTGGLIYVSTTGNDSTGNGTIGTPYATVTKGLAAGITAFPNGNFKVLLAAGKYNAETSSRWVLAGTPSQWVSVETQSGNQDVIIADDGGAGANTGAVEVRGSSVANIQIKNIQFQSSGASDDLHLFAFFPTGSGVTCTNLHFVNCIFQAIINSTTSFSCIYWTTDFPFNGIRFMGCNFTTTSSGTQAPQILFSETTTQTTANQPFTNLCFYNCTTDPNSAYGDFAINCFGLINPVFVGNVFTFTGHGLLLGADGTGPISTNPVPQCTGIYVGGNSLTATTGVGHGLLIGDACNSGIVEYNVIVGTVQGIVVKSSFGTPSANVVVRRNFVIGSGSGFVGAGLVSKASTYVQFLENFVYVQSTAGTGTTFEEEYDSTAPSYLAGHTTLQENYLIADGANMTLVNWSPSPQSTGGGTADWNTYEIRNGASWGTFRSATVSSLTSLQAAWAADGLTGDNPLGDAHSQVNANGSRADVSFTGLASTTYYAEYVDGYGCRFNGLTLEAYNASAEYRYAFFLHATATSTIYACPNPFNLQAGNYTVNVRQMLGPIPSMSDPVVSTQALVYAS